jgi:hypothetical protein
LVVTEGETMTTASTETASPERTLIVTWPDGLGNRLRGLLSGMVMAEASHRRFSFLWARTDACMASFPRPLRERLADPGSEP